MKHLLFLRWWLMVTLMAVGGWFSYKFNFFNELYDKDFTFLGFITIAVFIYMTIWCGIKTFHLSHAIETVKKGTSSEYYKNTLRRIKNLEEIGWFFAGVFTRMGFIGTIFGMIRALSPFFVINVQDPVALQALTSEMAYGMSTALYTTAVGLVCSTLLMFQYFNIGHVRREYEERL